MAPQFEEAKMTRIKLLLIYEEFKKLAFRGHVKAQGCLGEMYLSGKGVPQDYAEAAKWLRKAAGPA
jgi:TPR repeat protein